MNDVEYVRVRDGDPVIRFEAESAERYEKPQIMRLTNFSFEQYDSHGDEVNAQGGAGRASVNLDSGNIQLEGGVSLSVGSEDITIETPALAWQDEERLLSGNEQDKVYIHRSNGTNFSGQGFSADVRRRTWTFTSAVEGTYIYDDEDETAGEPEPAVAGSDSAITGESEAAGDDVAADVGAAAPVNAAEAVAADTAASAPAAAAGTEAVPGPAAEYK
jgi:LPS export ABC transporter protein LptC